MRLPGPAGTVFIMDVNSNVNGLWLRDVRGGWPGGVDAPRRSWFC
jgi:hypothetical protein